MSELKVYHCNEWHNEYTEFYLKSEADKVIAELIEKNERLSDDCLIKASNTFREIEKEIRHQKYKRCLAMAERCSERFHHYVVLSAFSPNKGAIPFYDKMRHKAYRWKYKWLELAEKFKEAK